VLLMPTKEWERVSKAAKKWGETKDCTVRALAIATKSTYEKAHGALALRGRNYRKGVAMTKVFAALHEWGYTVKTEYRKSDIDRIQRFKDYGWSLDDSDTEKMKAFKRSRWAKGKTIKSITPHLPSRGVFLIETRAHVLCVRGGEVHDWTDGRQHRITHVHRIIKSD